MEIPKTFVPEKDCLEELIKNEKPYSSIIVDNLFESCFDFLEMINEGHRPLYGRYEFGETLAGKFGCTKYDIEELTKRIDSVGLEEFEDKTELGIYFSALINKIITKKDTIRLTANLEYDYLGYRLNEGNLVVLGNLGDGVGDHMIGGRMTVRGYAGYWPGMFMEGGVMFIKGNTQMWVGHCMKGGKIVVYGNTEKGVGREMKGGTIIIKGDADELIGSGMYGGKIIIRGDANGLIGEDDMSGGEIHIHGKIRRIAKGCKGRIYHKNKLIWPRK